MTKTNYKSKNKKKLHVTKSNSALPQRHVNAWHMEILAGTTTQIGVHLNPGSLHFKNYGPKAVTLVPGEFIKPVRVETGQALVAYVRGNIHVENINDCAVNLEFEYRPVFLKH